MTMVAVVGAALLIVPPAALAAPASAAAPSWSIQPMPVPTGVSLASIPSVSCTSATNCIAVGDTFDATTDFDSVLTERWDGTSWQVVPAPSPSPRGDSLDSVSCVGADFCLAIGGAGTRPHIPFALDVVPLVERYDGQAWHVAKGPSRGNAFLGLGAVSCSTPTSCEATGSSQTNVLTSPLAESWDGSTWTDQKVPDPVAHNSSFLNAVSCTASSQCTAVGGDLHGWSGSGFTEQADFAARWDGSQWAEQFQANPNTYDTPDGVSCDAAVGCLSVGTTVTPSETVQALAEHSDGSGWAITPVPSPGTGDAYLYGVSCAGSTCQAIGDFLTVGTSSQVPTADVWNGTAWSAEAIPAPGQSTNMYDISCWSATGCMAVGVTGTEPFSELYAG